VKVLSWAIKITSLVITIPSTWVVASSVFHDFPQPLLFIVQLCAVALVDLLMLESWRQINIGTERQLPLERRMLDIATAWALYVGIGVIALQHGEGGAGLVFRGAMGLALLRDSLDTLLEWLRVRAERAARGVKTDWRVQHHAQRMARKEAIYQRERENMLTMKRTDADAAVQLAQIAMHTDQRLERVQRGEVVVHETAHPAVHALPSTAVQPVNTDADIIERMRTLVHSKPTIGKAEMARELHVSRTTVYKYWPHLHTNGHKEAV
jgi:hypothetical protein